MSLHAQLPNGEMTSEQMRFAASCIRPYGEDGCADITTRANLQLRGVKLEDAGESRPRAKGCSCVLLCEVCAEGSCCLQLAGQSFGGGGAAASVRETAGCWVFDGHAASILAV